MLVLCQLVAFVLEEHRRRRVAVQASEVVFRAHLAVLIGHHRLHADALGGAQFPHRAEPDLALHSVAEFLDQALATLHRRGAVGRRVGDAGGVGDELREAVDVATG